MFFLRTVCVFMILITFRYDYIDSEWIYKHDGRSLKTLLTEEMRQLMQDDKIDFSHCV